MLRYSMQRACQHAIVLIMVGCSSVAQGADFVDISAAQFSESVDVAGQPSRGVVGVMRESRVYRARLDALFIDVADWVDVSLCVNVTSVDGRYHARFEYVLTKRLGGWTRFRLPTAVADVIGQYLPQQMAVLAEIKNRCDGRVMRVVPTAWGRPVSERLAVQVQSPERAVSLAVVGRDGTKGQVACRSVAQGAAIGFNWACQIDRPQRYRLRKTWLVYSDDGLKPERLPIGGD